ncbi:MAG: Quinoprotein glucose dehydrogenase [Candidatus Daviesbacteria bacterium GW2011_GWF2_38_7]|nr:MAG: Quinoprotein glucose dehydrogenase [Candidatus Daviesbacteria bacterium GW2011_GWF2_38_7]
MKNLGFVLVIIISLIIGLSLLQSSQTTMSEDSAIKSGQQIQGADFQTSSPAQVTQIAQNLDTPWSLVFLPDKSMLVTERVGRVRIIDAGGNLQSEPVAVIEKAKEIGEGGLLGIALHPAFSDNNSVYLYYTYSAEGENTKNRVVQMTYRDKKLSDEKIIVDNISGASNHNGGRIKFGPDGFLYITTGDAQNPSQAQDKASLAGKILRVPDQGNPAPDNPFGNLVYSYGHRNPQGITWDASGQLWETEHGPSTKDEINRIEKGKNYGWPDITGDETKQGMETPVLNSGTNTWAPSGTVFFRNSVFFAGLRGQALFEAKTEGGNMSPEEHFKGEFGRIRDVILGPDNMFYIATSNQDGRGLPKDTDDRIIKLNPQKL